MKLKFTLLFYTIAVSIFAQIPTGYYNLAEGKTGSELKTALFNIVNSHSVLSYDDLLTAFQTTDKRADGKVWDIYSNVTNYVFGSNQCGTYSLEGDCYNREHSFPKSWFNNATPMYTDLFHLYPSDGYVNGIRSNYPFGKVGTTTAESANGYSKLGSSATTSYTGIVFEPADELKGDMARTYFYMVTAYENVVNSWNSPHLNGTAYPAFNTWTISLLLKWNADDPVSQKEIDRNNAIFIYFQHNRNPFIDYPDLAEYIWGSKIGIPFSPTGNSDVCTNLNYVIDFTKSLAPFNAYDVSGSQYWRSTTYGATASGYVSGVNYANEDWLISQSFDLSKHKDAKITFDHAINFADLSKLQENHSLWVSTNLSDGNPQNGTWTQISIPQYPAGSNWIFVNAGTLNISDEFCTKNTTFAFKYLCDNVKSSTWEIKNFKLTATCKSTSTNISSNPSNKYRIVLNGRNATVTGLNKKDISVYDVYGRNIQTIKNAQENAIISFSDTGIYIVKINNEIQKIIVK